MNHNNSINNYVLTQLQSGLNPDNIASQLRAAGWPEDSISQAFQAAQNQLTPQIPSAENNTTLPPPADIGQMKAGWLLFKQSLSVIKNNAGLTRYMVMSIVMSFVVVIIGIAALMLDDFTILTVSDPSNASNSSMSLTVIGLAFIILLGIVINAVGLFYATAISSHVLAIFRGSPGTYSQHMASTRRKVFSIVLLALINTTVGLLLNTIAEKSKMFGRLTSRLAGIAWSLGTTFTVPIIADTDQSAVDSIKSSIALFRQTWGETIVSRISLGGLVFSVYAVISLPLVLLSMTLLSPTVGQLGIIIILVLFSLGVMIISVLDQLATYILNTGLYYFAKYKTIPPSYSPELLSSALVRKNTKTK